MSEQQRNLSGDQVADKAGDLARQNPEAARSVIDKVEDAVDKATGGRFSDAIDKGGDLVEQKLGLPNNAGGTEGGTQGDTEEPTEGPTDPLDPAPQPPPLPEDSTPSGPPDSTVPSEPSVPPSEPSTVPTEPGQTPPDPQIPRDPGTPVEDPRHPVEPAEPDTDPFGGPEGDPLRDALDSTQSTEIGRPGTAPSSDGDPTPRQDGGA